jgi:hypothetical protein
MLITKLLPKLKQDLIQARSSLPATYLPVTDTDSVPVLQSPLDFNSPTTIDLASAVNICFDCNNNFSTTEVKKSYFHSLVNDLEIRNITVPPVTSHAATLSAQASLLAIMKLETRISRLEAEIEFIEHNATSSAYLTENACPCSLHLEMRIMLKLLTTLIRDGLARAMLNERHDLKAAKAFIQEVQTVLKTKVLGTVGRPHSYTIPFDPKNRTVGDLNMNNGPCRKVLKKFEELIKVCITKPGTKDHGYTVQEEVNLWSTAIAHYRDGLHIMLSKVDCSEEKVIRMQNHFDMFSQILIFKLGYDKEIITNYMHLIHTGHMAEYMFHLKCLYRHSQQGWEHLMSNLKQYVFRRSNRGGGRGTGNRLEAIAHHRSRLFAYMIGESFEEMKDKLTGNQITITNRDVDRMEFPDAGQDEVRDIDTDTREDLLLLHEHSKPNISIIQEV